MLSGRLLLLAVHRPTSPLTTRINTAILDELAAGITDAVRITVHLSPRSLLLPAARRFMLAIVYVSRARGPDSLGPRG